MGSWITRLIDDYKYIDGQHFGERKHWLHDDYVKFMRFAESLINKNGEGVLAFVTIHGYLDNQTFRGMRWHLLKTFDKIWIVDLHGNSKKKEVTPEGHPDKNVFDIQQGVAIIIAVKFAGGATSQAIVQHSETWGSREKKYDFLSTSALASRIWRAAPCHSPQFAFVTRDNKLATIYEEGFSVAKLMTENVTGIVTAKDSLVIDFTKVELIEKITRF